MWSYDLMNKRLGSSYIENENKANTGVVRGRKSLYASIFSASLAFVVLILTLQPFLMAILGNNNEVASNSSVSTLAQAGEPGFICSTEFGTGMDRKSPWEGAMDIKVYPDLGSREVTIQDALGKGLSFVSYAGEGEAKDLFGVKPKKDPKPGDKVFGDSEAKFDELFKKNKSKFEKERTFGQCFNSFLIPQAANLNMLMANGITKIAQFSAVMVFNGNLICPEPGKGGVCLDLIGIIGGTGGEGEGIVGILTSSIYFPLLVIAVAVTAFWVLKKGVIDRKIREALFGALWLCLSVIIGLALLLNPLLITKAPMAVSNAVSTCVIGAFNGKNCFDSSGTNSIKYEDGDSTSEKVCRSSSDQASIDEQMTFTTGSITCSIWKAFVLEPFSQGSFGTSFNDLDVKANPELNKLLKDQKLDPNMYCVNLGTTKSLTSQSGKFLQLDSEKNKVCNLMAYQMYLKTQATTSGDKDVTNIDYKWYRVIMASVSDNGLWANWTNTGAGINKLGVSFIALLASGLGTFIIFITSLFALVYYISSVILMAFAPIFFLMGVHPGRGKSILLGWVEKVVSNVLKYMASAVFLVVTISIYGGILGSIDNIGLTLLFVIIITMALFMYRGELIDLLGKASMGGEKLSNKLTDKLGDKSKGALKFAGSTAIAGAGGVAGAALTSGNKPFQKGFGRDVRAGFQDSVKRETKRNSGFIGNVARQYDRNTVDNKQDLRAKSQNKASAAERSQSELEENRGYYNDALNDRDNLKNNAEIDKIDLEELDDGHKKIQNAEKASLNDFRKSTDKSYDEKRDSLQKENLPPEEMKIKIDKLDEQKGDAHDFADLQSLMNEIRDDKIQIEVAARNNDTDEVNRLRSEVSDKNTRAEKLRSNISDRNMNRFSKQYEGSLESKRQIGVIPRFDDEMRDALVGKRIAVENHDRLLDEANDKLQQAHEEMTMTEEEYKTNKRASELYENQFIDMKPGEGLTDKGIKKLDKRVEKENREINNETNDNFANFRHEENERLSENKDKDKELKKSSINSEDREGFGNYIDKNKIDVLDDPKDDNKPKKPSNSSDDVNGGKNNINTNQDRVKDSNKEQPKPAGDKPDSSNPKINSSSQSNSNKPKKDDNKPKNNDKDRPVDNSSVKPTTNENAANNRSSSGQDRAKSGSSSSNPNPSSSSSNNSNKSDKSSSTPAPKKSSDGGGRRVADSVSIADNNNKVDDNYRQSHDEFEEQLKKSEEDYIKERKKKIDESNARINKGNNDAIRNQNNERREEINKNNNNNPNGNRNNGGGGIPRTKDDPRNRRNN